MSIQHQDRIVDGVTLRYCNAHGDWAQLELFSKAAHCAGGRSSECRACTNARKRGYRAGKPWRERDRGRRASASIESGT